MKGTGIIRDVILKLQREGYEIAYKEVIGVPNEVVFEEIKRCDLLIDELYSDSHGVVFALEARSRQSRCSYAVMAVTSLVVSNLKAQEFATGWASPKEVTRRFLQLIKGEAPDSWFFDPSDICYTHGVGGLENKVRMQVRRLLTCAGSEALKLEDKPELCEKLIAFGAKTSGV